MYEEVDGTLPQKGINLPGPIGDSLSKENHIGPAVSEILQYTQTDRLIDILLLFIRTSGYAPRDL